jgi:hypothetical protein
LVAVVLVGATGLTTSSATAAIVSAIVLTISLMALVVLTMGSTAIGTGFSVAFIGTALVFENLRGWALAKRFWVFIT